MRQERFKIVYDNGKQHQVLASNIHEAVVKAMAYALRVGWKMKLESLAYENGNKIYNVDIVLDYTVK